MELPLQIIKLLMILKRFLLKIRHVKPLIKNSPHLTCFQSANGSKGHLNVVATWCQWSSWQQGGRVRIDARGPDNERTVTAFAQGRWSLKS